MSAFEQIRNHNEQAVFTAIHEIVPEFPAMGSPDTLADVACVALNKLPARYIRHSIDFAFYTGERERLDNERLVLDSVRQAFAFVQARNAMRARG